MRKRLLPVVCALTALMVVTLGWWLLGQHEPRYKGKSLNAWLAHLDLGVSEPPEKAAEAVRAVRAIGTNSFPCLLGMLSADDAVWQRALIAFNARQSALRLPVTPASLIRARAIDGYTALGATANDAVPGLIRLMDSANSPEVRASVASALGQIGPGASQAIPALQKAACGENAEVRKSALFALRNILRMNDSPAQVFERRY
jgi:HEAT repeat protein